jgi:hypothetical protein
MNIDKSDKWLLVSCLQKSIRKGFEDLAITYAEKLYEIDKSYLLYRLSIIALEDIGLGNIDVVHDFLSTQIKKDNIANKGGKNYILNVVSDFSKSIKDRSACDLTELATIKSGVKLFNNENLDMVFLDNNETIINRLFAGWNILGSKKLKNPLISESEDDLEKFLDLNKKIIKNPKILDIIKDAYKIHREPHFIALGLLESLLDKETGMKMGQYETGYFVKKDFNIDFADNKWLIDGIDWHTKEGKSAIYDFCKEKTITQTNLKKLGVTYDKMPLVIGMLLFRHIGHQVDKRLFYPSAVITMKLTERIGFKNIIGNNNADFTQIMKTFVEDYPILQKKIKEKFKLPDPKFFPF